MKNENYDRRSTCDDYKHNHCDGCGGNKPKGDLISREALIKWIDDSVSQYGYTYSTDMLNMWGLFKDYLINNAPAVERPQGEWIRTALYGETCYECNKCNRHQPHITKFCPNCGADMRGKADQLRDCENCVHHSDNGCEVWECEFEKRSDV